MKFSRKLMIAGLLVSQLTLPLSAQAQEVKGWYGAASLGANWHGDVNSTVHVTGLGEFDQYISSSRGFAGATSLGWGFGNGLRVEAELSHHSNNVNRVGLTQGGVPVAVTERSGRVATTGLMVNALYDFNLGPVMPYLGGGIGYGLHRWSDVGAVGNGVARTTISDTDGQFAYQGIAGLSFPIRAVPGLALTTEYRYFATRDVSLTGTFQPLGGGASASTTKVEENHNHSVLIGMRYAFGK